MEESCQGILTYNNQSPLGKKFDVDMSYLISNGHKADELRSQTLAEDLTVNSVLATSQHLVGGGFTLYRRVSASRHKLHRWC